MAVIDIEGVRHAFRLEGHENRPVLVLVHAIGSDHSLWDAVVPALPRFRILRYDLRGHGATPAPASPCTLSTLAQDLLALTSALGIEAFALAGASLGAMVAAQAAAAAPQRVTGLVLCSVAPRIGGPPGGWDQRARDVMTNGTAPLAPGMRSRMFSPSWLERGEPATESLVEVLRRTDPAGYAACCCVLRDTDLSLVMPQVRAPVLIVRGAQDPLVSAGDQQALAAFAPGARQLVIEGGHYPMVEKASEWAAAVTGFLTAAEPWTS